MSFRTSQHPHRVIIAIALVFSAVTSLWLFGARSEPAALMLRMYYEKFASATAVETDHYSSGLAVKRKANRNYGDGGVETAFDVYRPVTANANALPTVFWLHGGGWVGGSKENVAPFLRKISSSRFTVVALNYPLAPDHAFPAAITAVNSGIAYVLDRAESFGIDPNNIVIAGNGAGANLASQVAAMATNADYADRLGISSTLSTQQLRGVVLNGGIFDVATTDELSGLTRIVTKYELWAYTGQRDATNSPAASLISTIDALTARFPATWMTAGDADQLPSTQSAPFAQALVNAGVPTTTLFADAGSGTPSDYQFMLALPEARRAFTSLLEFLHQVTDS